MNVTYSKNFSKQFKKLPLKVQNQFFLRLEQFLSNPSHPTLRVHTLTAQYKNYSSFNVTGDVRVIFYRGPDVIQLVAIGSHSELYT